MPGENRFEVCVRADRDEIYALSHGTYGEAFTDARDWFADADLTITITESVTGENLLRVLT